MAITYDELSEMWAADSDIDSNDITGEVQKLSKLHSKYYKLYIEETLRAKKIETTKQKLMSDKYDYYSGVMDIEEIRERGWKPLPKLILKNDVQRHVDNDEQVIELTLKLAYAKSVVDYLESITKMISNRGYNLRLIFDFERFRSGG